MAELRKHIIRYVNGYRRLAFVSFCVLGRAIGILGRILLSDDLDERVLCANSGNLRSFDAP